MKSSLMDGRVRETRSEEGRIGPLRVEQKVTQKRLTRSKLKYIYIYSIFRRTVSISVSAPIDRISTHPLTLASLLQSYLFGGL